MSDFSSAFKIAFELLASFDVDLRAIVLLSLEVSVTASVCAFVIAAPLRTALATRDAACLSCLPTPCLACHLLLWVSLCTCCCLVPGHLVLAEGFGVKRCPVMYNDFEKAIADRKISGEQLFYPNADDPNA
jgi:hypothetical protein